MYDKQCYSHECGQTGYERAHAGDNNDGVAEPLTSASIDDGHVHVWKGACSHGGGGVGERARGAVGKKGAGEVCSGVSQLQQEQAMVCDAHQLGSAWSVVLWSCVRVPSSLSSPRLRRPAPPGMGAMTRIYRAEP